jgi:hypothetical protein
LDFDSCLARRLSAFAVKIDLDFIIDKSGPATDGITMHTDAEVHMAPAALSASSATSALSGLDFDFCFARRLSASAVKIHFTWIRSE